jgi:peptide deformylase
MVREIIIFPDAVLRRVCEPVTRFDASLKQLLDDMEHTMMATRGAGLAAPQIGHPLRAVVLLVTREEVPEGETPFEVLRLVNPVIVERRGAQIGKEGCLSFPNHFDTVRRAQWVRVEAQDERGNKLEVGGDGYLARALQHELEHLDGVLFVDHLSLLKRNQVSTKFKKAKARGLRYSADKPEPQDFTIAPS